METDEKLLSQYNSDIELYKFYINFVLKINAFHYAMSAAIFTFLLTNKTEQYLEYILVFPIIFSLTIIGIGVFGYPAVDILNKGTKNNARKLEYETYPDFTTLKGIIAASVLAHIIIIFCSLLMFCWLPIAASPTAVPPG